MGAGAGPVNGHKDAACAPHTKKPRPRPGRRGALRAPRLRRPMTRSTATRVVLSTAIALMLAGCAHQRHRNEAPGRKAPPVSASKPDEIRKQAEQIGMQPARDMGLSKRKIPPVLEDALADPYSTKGLKTCSQLA